LASGPRCRPRRPSRPRGARDPEGERRARQAAGHGPAAARRGEPPFGPGRCPRTLAPAASVSHRALTAVAPVARARQLAALSANAARRPPGPARLLPRPPPPLSQRPQRTPGRRGRHPSLRGRRMAPRAPVVSGTRKRAPVSGRTPERHFFSTDLAREFEIWPL